MVIRIHIHSFNQTFIFLARSKKSTFQTLLFSINLVKFFSEWIINLPITNPQEALSKNILFSHLWITF
jgi:hypothetical protein